MNELEKLKSQLKDLRTPKGNTASEVVEVLSPNNGQKSYEITENQEGYTCRVRWIKMCKDGYNIYKHIEIYELDADLTLKASKIKSELGWTCWTRSDEELRLLKKIRQQISGKEFDEYRSSLPEELKSKRNLSGTFGELESKNRTSKMTICISK